MATPQPEFDALCSMIQKQPPQTMVKPGVSEHVHMLHEAVGGTSQTQHAKCAEGIDQLAAFSRLEALTALRQIIESNCMMTHVKKLA
jgi:hypothetical protein